MRPAVYPVTDPETGQRTADLKKPHRQALIVAVKHLVATSLRFRGCEGALLAREAATYIQQTLECYPVSPKSPDLELGVTEKKQVATADEILMAVQFCNPDSKEGKSAKEATNRIQHVLALCKAVPETPKKKDSQKDLFEDAEV